MVSCVEFKKNVGERSRLTAELDEDRREEGADILLSGILEIEEEIRQVRRPSVGSAFNILDDSRANGSR